MELASTGVFDLAGAVIPGGAALKPGWRWLPVPFNEPTDVLCHVHELGPVEAVELKLQDGTRAVFGPNHRVLTMRGAARAAEVRPGWLVPAFRYEPGGEESLSTAEIAPVLILAGPGLPWPDRTWTPAELWRVLSKSRMYPYNTFAPGVVQYLRVDSVRRTGRLDAVTVVSPLGMYISQGGLICLSHPPKLP